MAAKILIVDDSATDRMLIRNMLSDYDILTAGDGLEALHQIESNPDIVLQILDLNMPRMDGFQVLAALRSDDRYHRLRTIILTNYDEPENEIKGLKAGAVDYIRKPLQMESLRARIEIHLELLRIQRLYKKELDIKNLLLDTLFDQAPIGITIAHGYAPSDPDEDHLPVFNAMFERILGRNNEELIRLGWAQITHPDDVEKDLDYYHQLENGEIDTYNMEKRFIRPDGSIVWTDMVVARLDLQNDSKYKHICIVRDITERKEQEIRLKRTSEIDNLTGLNNRRYLENLLTVEAVSKAHIKRAIVLLSLKKINSLTLTYGYNFSEKIIKELSVALQAFANPKCQLFQISFERFAFYVEDYQDFDDLHAVCDAITAAVSGIQVLQTVGCGIGVVAIAPKYADADSIIKNATMAAEQVDESQIFGCRLFDNVLADKAKRETRIKEAIIRAINHSQHDRIFMEYQPILNLKTNQIKGFEALARLQSGQLGVVSPCEFIPLAEEMQMIVPVGKKIMEMVCVFQKQLAAMGYDDIIVSINFSGLQLLRQEFFDDLLNVLATYQINPNNIGLEITESIFAGNFVSINEELGKIKDMGMEIYIDDFGTGYSSLARERELNVTYIKIDKFFIDKLLTIEASEAITGDIISMGHKLGHRVVAEGVEHEVQKQYLIDHDCDLMQGYLFSPPLEEEAAIDFLKAKK